MRGGIKLCLPPLLECSVVRHILSVNLYSGRTSIFQHMAVLFSMLYFDRTTMELTMIAFFRHMILCAVVISAVGSASTLSAAEPIDNVVKNAVIDIERYEAQAVELNADRKSQVRRMMKLVDMSHQRLQESTNQTDASWQEVNERYLVLKARLDGLFSGEGDPTPKGSDSSASNQDDDATPLETQPVADVPELVSGQRVRVKKTTRDMNAFTQSLVTTGPSLMQDPEQVARYAKRMGQFKEAVQRYPQLTDPDVQAMRSAYQRLVQALDTEYKRAQAQRKQIGDVQQRLTAIETNSRTYAAPDVLQVPFTQEQAAAWVKAAGATQQVAKHALEQLKPIAELAYLPNNPGVVQDGAPYDANDVDRLTRNAAAMLEDVTTHYNAISQGLQNSLAQITNDALSRWQEDPDSDQRWLFIAEGKQQEAFAVYDEGLAAAQSALYFAQAMGTDPEPATEIIAQLNQAKRTFLEKKQIALATSRMPSPQSQDAKMLAIAAEIIGIPRYEFGESGSVVLTTEAIVERESKESEIKFDGAKVMGGDVTLTGTETTWTYRWQEFKFAVPLHDKDTDLWYIWWITAKNYSSGANSTPLNQWISGSAKKGNQILAENIE